MFGDMIRETSTTTGTGAFTTTGATAGYQTFLAAIGSGKVCVYRARNLNSPSEWETGVGTVAAGSLSRVTVLASSNGGALVNFGSGTKEIIGTAHSGGLLSKVTSKTAAYTVLAADFGAVLACSGTWSLTLPAVATLGNGWSCWVKNTGSGTITLYPNASETIDGATTAPLAAGESALIVCSGAAWVTIKGGSSSLTALASGSVSAPSLAWSGEATGLYRWSTAGVSLALGGKEIMRSYSQGNPGGASAGTNHFVRIGQDVSSSAGENCFQIALSRYGGDTDSYSVGYGFLLKSNNGLRGGISSTAPFLDLIGPTLAYGGAIIFKTANGQQYSNIGVSGNGISFNAVTDSYNFSCYIDQQGGVKTFRPGSDNVVSLGHASYRWATVYAGSSTISTSDARLKTDIADSDLGLVFIQALRPVRYRMADQPAQSETVRTVGADGEIVETVKETEPAKTFARPHYGLIAQEVKQVIDSLGIDFAGYTDPTASGDTGPLGLRYEEFIGPLIKAVQELSAQNAALEARIAALEAP